MGCIQSRHSKKFHTDSRSSRGDKVKVSKGDSLLSVDEKVTRELESPFSTGDSTIASFPQSGHDAPRPFPENSNDVQLSQPAWSEYGATTENITLERFEEIKREGKAKFDTSLSLIGLFDNLMLWYATPTGGFTPSLARAGTFCEALANQVPPKRFIVENAREDPRFSKHPSVCNRPYATFYAGCPLLSHQHCLGTFSVIEFHTKSFPDDYNRELERYAALVVEELQREMYQSLAREFSISMDEAKNMPLPTVWIDVSNHRWPVVASNEQWDRLSRVPPKRCNKAGGVWRLMGAASTAEYEFLQDAVSNNAKFTTTSSTDNRIDGYPAILCPLASRNPRQYIFELRPADPEDAVIIERDRETSGAMELLSPPPTMTTLSPTSLPITTGIWKLITHARIVADLPMNPVSHVAVTRSSNNSDVDRRHHRSTHSLTSVSDAPRVTAAVSLESPANAVLSRATGGATVSMDDDDDEEEEEEEKKKYPPVTPDHSYHNTPRASPRDSIERDNSARPTLVVPPRLATLTIGYLIGHGSYGNVYSGRLHDQPVAIKVLEGSVHEDAERQQWDAQFEALLALDLRHPNVLSTLDFCIQEATEERGSQVWIVQPLCQLGTLAGAIRRGQLCQNQDPASPPDLGAVLGTALEIAEATKYLHSKNIVHGDLSSNNVLLAADDADRRGFRGVISDFGLSRISTQKEVSTKTVGTVSHMAPEVLMEGLMSEAGDVYSFGVILWELYCGKRAWEGSSMAQVIFNVTCRGERPTLPDDAPLSLRALMDECVDEDRAKRLRFDAVVVRLKQIMTEFGLQELLR